MLHIPCCMLPAAVSHRNSVCCMSLPTDQAIYDEISVLPPSVYGGPCSPRTMRQVCHCRACLRVPWARSWGRCGLVVGGCGVSYRRSCFGSTRRSTGKGYDPPITHRPPEPPGSSPRPCWTWSDNKRTSRPCCTPLQVRRRHRVRRLRSLPGPAGDGVVSESEVRGLRAPAALWWALRLAGEWLEPNQSSFRKPT